MNEEASDSYATASRLASEMHSGESHRISTNLAMKAMETRTKPDRVRTRADLDYLSNKEPKFRRAGDLDHRIAARVGIRALNVVLKGWRVFYEEYDWGSGPEDLKGLWDVLGQYSSFSTTRIFADLRWNIQTSSIRDLNQCISTTRI